MPPSPKRMVLLPTANYRGPKLLKASINKPLAAVKKEGGEGERGVFQDEPLSRDFD